MYKSYIYVRLVVDYDYTYVYIHIVTYTFDVSLTGYVFPLAVTLVNPFTTNCAGRQ